MVSYKYQWILLTSYFIPPHPWLQPFIDNYILCTSGGEKLMLRSAWPASNETSLIFYLADTPSHHTDELKSSALQNKNGCVVGLLSHFNGVVCFNGIYHTFLIQFKANGFNKIFRMPAAEFINKIFYMDEVFGPTSRHLNEALQNAKDIQQMACFADEFLLHFLNLQRATINLCDSITFISNELSRSTLLLSIGQYASKANMSIRNFGRRFTEQTGVSPKFYCRLLRFNNAINAKLKKPQSSWTSIAYQCGYYDQMHMIKDFQQFANLTPSVLFQSNMDFATPYIDLTVSQTDAFPGPDTLITNEEFVLVKRTAF